MVHMVYPLTCDSHGSEEKEAMKRVIESGLLTVPSGKIVHQFEEEFAKKVGAKYAVMVNSGSSANLIAIASLFYKKDRPLKRGDEIIVPAIGWSTSFAPLQQYGLKVKIVDVELNTLNINVMNVLDAITPKTRAILVVNILGNPANLRALRNICDHHGFDFIEDNCESLAATFQGKQCGTFGDMGTSSFFYSHHLSTGEGGMLVTESQELRDIARSLRDHGWTRSLPADSVIYQKKSGDRFEAYRFILPGYNLRPQEVNGAAGLEQLKKLDAFIEQRRKNAKVFQKLFTGDDRFIIQKENGKSSWFNFAVILNPKYKADREKVFNGLKEASIEHRIITGGNVVRHDMISHFDYEVVGGLQNADIAHDWGFFVGNFGKDLSDLIRYFHETLLKLV